KRIPEPTLLVRCRSKPGSVGQHNRLAAYGSPASAITGNQFLSTRPGVAIVVGNHVPRLPLSDRLSDLKEKNKSSSGRIEEYRIPMWMLTNLGNFNGHGPIIRCAFGDPYPYVVMFFVCATKPGNNELSVGRPHDSRCVTLRERFFIAGDEASAEYINTYLNRSCYHTVLLLPRT